MGVKAGKQFTTQDVFIDYPFESVKFRWDHRQRRVYRKFYGDAEETEVPYNSTLFNEALASGSQIEKDDYLRIGPEFS